MNNRKFEFWLFCFSILIFIFFLFQAIMQTGIGLFVDFTFAADLGDALAGILSFISVLLIYRNLIHQSEAFYLSQFENKYFEQIKFHRENVQNLEYKSPESSNIENPNIKHNHQVFISIFREILLAINSLNGDFYNNELNSIYKNENIQSDRLYSLALDNRQINMLELEKINIAFLIVYFGVAKEGLLVLRNMLGEIYDEEFIKTILDNFSRIPVKWSDFHNKNDIPITAKFVKYFGGHQHSILIPKN